MEIQVTGTVGIMESFDCDSCADHVGDYQGYREIDTAYGESTRLEIDEAVDLPDDHEMLRNSDIDIHLVFLDSDDLSNEDIDYEMGYFPFCLCQDCYDSNKIRDEDEVPESVNRHASSIF